MDRALRDPSPINLQFSGELVKNTPDREQADAFAPVGASRFPPNLFLVELLQVFRMFQPRLFMNMEPDSLDFSVLKNSLRTPIRTKGPLSFDGCYITFQLYYSLRCTSTEIFYNGHELPATIYERAESGES
ncbi:hypothetical protein L1987_00417 [Smallanthus sonchifolius]|uniref:Uncharacterized protein n=1 Tax=Smallanthus sonchifolius TaxID=185202 RepID=A0ACB9K2E3_9ASTR|nr:hypothetical protein L1987_00417 [Smallanthus sonchifolius]